MRMAFLEGQSVAGSVRIHDGQDVVRILWHQRSRSPRPASRSRPKEGQAQHGKLSFNPPISPSIHSSIHPSSDLSIHFSFLPFFHLPSILHLSFYHISVLPSIIPSVLPSFPLSIQPSFFHPSFHLLIYPLSICSSVLPFIHLPVYPSSVPRSMHLSFLPNFLLSFLISLPSIHPSIRSSPFLPSFAPSNTSQESTTL